jgi:hypothetical protein
MPFFHRPPNNPSATAPTAALSRAHPIIILTYKLDFELDAVKEWEER